MLYPFRINSRSGEEQQPRCSIRKFAGGYGFCQGGAISCASCPRAKLDEHSPERIEEQDTVRTAAGELCRVECFEERRGFQTGYIWLRGKRGLIRLTVAAVALHSKRATHLAVA